MADTTARNKTFLFHVGLPKTGTTSIQSALVDLSPELERLGVFFPHDAARHPDVPKAAVQQEGMQYFAPAPQSAPAGYDWKGSVTGFLEAPDMHIYLFSREELWLHADRLDPAVFDMLKRNGAVTFLVYLRHPVAYLGSLFLQETMGIAPPRARLRSAAAKRYCEGGFLSQLALFAARGTLCVKDFDRARQGGRLIEDAFETFGCAAALHGGYRPDIQNVTRLPFELAALFVALKLVARPDPETWQNMRRKLIAAALTIRAPLKTSALAQSHADAILQTWFEEKAELEKIHGVAIDEVDFTPGPEVLSFSADFASQMRQRLESALGPDERALLGKALEYADADLEEICLQREPHTAPQALTR